MSLVLRRAHAWINIPVMKYKTQNDEQVFRLFYLRRHWETLDY